MRYNSDARTAFFVTTTTLHKNSQSQTSLYIHLAYHIDKEMEEIGRGVVVRECKLFVFMQPQ